MDIVKYAKMFGISLAFDLILVLVAFGLGKWYFMSIFFSLILNTVAAITNRIRPKMLGYIRLREKGEAFYETLYLLSSIVPLFNIFFSVNRYHFNNCVSDEKFIKKFNYMLVPFKENAKNYVPCSSKRRFIYVPLVKSERDVKIEFEKITTKDYNLSLEMEQINYYIDYIMLNKNLDKEQKEYILQKFREKLLLSKKIDLSERTIKKLIKC